MEKQIVYVVIREFDGQPEDDADEFITVFASEQNAQTFCDEEKAKDIQEAKDHLAECLRLWGYPKDRMSDKPVNSGYTWVVRPTELHP